MKMVRITRGEESKLTNWYFGTDLKLVGLLTVLLLASVIMMITAGSAEANRLSHPWYFFLQKAIPFYLIGIFSFFFCSMLNKKWILYLAWAMFVVGMGCMILTLVQHGTINGSTRWVTICGFRFLPADVLKPALIMLTAWFLQRLQGIYGENIFCKGMLKFRKDSWWPYIIAFLICFGIMVKQPDLGTGLLFAGVFLIMALVAGMPIKMFGIICAVGGSAVLVYAMTTMSHIQTRVDQIFYVPPRTQVWYSLNAIRHGGLFGSGAEAYVQEVLPEATNDFIFAAIVENWGAIAACVLIAILYAILKVLINHAISAKDDFVIYALTGTATLFFGQICFNLMTSLHILLNKGMTLPFVSYGGGSFISFCVLFGMILALIREDVWNNG